MLSLQNPTSPALHSRTDTSSMQCRDNIKHREETHGIFYVWSQLEWLISWQLWGSQGQKRLGCKSLEHSKQLFKYHENQIVQIWALFLSDFMAAQGFGSEYDRRHRYYLLRPLKVIKTFPENQMATSYTCIDINAYISQKKSGQSFPLPSQLGVFLSKQHTTKNRTM